jgi:hypothetical protein
VSGYLIAADPIAERVVMLRKSAIDGLAVRQVDVMTEREARKASRDLLRAAEGLAGRFPVPVVAQAAEPAQAAFDLDLDLEPTGPGFSTTSRSN